MQWKNIYNKLALVAQDILAASAVKPTWKECFRSVAGLLLAAETE